MKKPGPYTPLLARCREATRNANAAQLLYRVAFWMPHAKIKRAGKTWSANSAAQWCGQTGLTLDQYRRAIALLRKLDLVETSQHLWGNKNVTHVRLTSEGQRVVAVPSPGNGDTAPPTGSNSAQSEMGENAQLYIHGESNLEGQLGESEIAFANAHAEDQSINTSKKYSGKSTSYSNTKIIQNSKEKSANVDPDSPRELANLWNMAVSETTGDYVPPFNGKQFNQLKSFRAACPPGRAPAILEACLRNWPAVVDAAKAQGAHDCPFKPSLGFLLKFATEAINVGLDMLKPKAAITSSKPQKQNCAMEAKTTEVSLNELTHDFEHQRASLEEIKEILKSENE
jgi:hypothetical protein